MLSSFTPRPIKIGIAAGSPASSPHTPTHLPCALAACTVCRIWISTAGCSASCRCATAAIAPLGGQRVLCQIVRADAEEIDFGGQDVRQDRRRWNLHHDAHIHPIGQRRFLGLQFRAGFVQQRAGAAHFSHVGDHREHDLQVVTGASRAEWRATAS